MNQYYKVKKHHKDKIIFFRMGDFFEMFDKDAEIVAPILDISLTCRNKKAGLKTKMCGLPHHSISGPISKLLDKGFHVVICDQVEGELEDSGLVKRAVTRVLSPGMVYDLKTLDGLSPNYLSAFDKKTLSFLDISTGSSFYYEYSNSIEFFKLLDQFQPKEIVVTATQKKLLPASFASSLFEEALDLSDPSFDPNLPKSAQRLLAYVKNRQGLESLKLLKSFKKINSQQEMYYSSQLYAHLEVFKNYEGTNKDTLFWAINRTKTPNGARLLKRRLQSPLIDQKKIEKRWSAIEEWLSRPQLLQSVRSVLSLQGDGERKIGQLIQATVNGRDLLALADWLDKGLQIEALLKKEAFPFLLPSQNIQQAGALSEKIKHIIAVDGPVQLKSTGLINKGVNPQLDEWISLSKNSQKRILAMEQSEQKKLNIPSLKIRYNSVFGYYIEVRKTHNSKIPSYYKRKQTLVQSERYITKELYEIEQKILMARSKQMELETQIFKDLKSEILEDLPLLFSLCKAWSKLDLYSALAFVSLENQYVRPQFATHFKVRASRHPVLEQKNFNEFVSNSLDMPSQQTVILTGPNMAGKSTLMRQLALTVLLAQTGCFVPADKAELPLFHKMFTRMGASDFLSKGLSTFMVEMQETAEILQKADSKSLIILDELGRGTATFDGMSLAQSIIEFLTLEKKPLLFSATHYQELTKLASQIPSVCNRSMQIKEDKGEIHFLYFLKEGPASKSYGIPVARLAGLPEGVLKRAEKLLSRHESLSSKSSVSHKASVPSSGFKTEIKKNPDYRTEKKQTEELLEELIHYPLMTKSPLDALNQIKKWQDRLNLESKIPLKALKTKAYEDLEQTSFTDILN